MKQSRRKKPISTQTAPENAETTQNQLNDFISADMLVSKFPQFPKESVRWWIRNRKNNGLSPSVVVVGRKLLIHVPGFCDWLQSHAGR